MFRITATACVLSAALALPAFAQGSQQSENQGLSQQARQFLNHLAETNQSEVRMGLLAERNATDPAVKAYARLTAADHIEAENLLSHVMSQYNMRGSGDISSQDHQEMQRLEQMSGRQFDTAFMREEVQEQKQSLQELQQRRQSIKAFPVDALIESALPIQQQHLALAEAVEQHVNSGNGGGSGSQQAASNSGNR